MCVVQPWTDDYRRQDPVHSYVCTSNNIRNYIALACRLRFDCVVVNGCVCHNGVAEIGTGCTTDGASKCASCKTGFTINHERTKCIRTYTHFRVRTHSLTRFESVRCCFFRLSSKYVHMQEWRAGTRWPALPCEWCCVLLGVQHWVDD